jgi:hypothetical protein
MQTLLAEPAVQKILIEPHLKERLRLQSSKVRFQGCHAARHDDHVHVQIQGFRDSRFRGIPGFRGFRGHNTIRGIPGFRGFRGFRGHNT